MKIISCLASRDKICFNSKKVFRKNAIPLNIIGKVKKGPPRVLERNQKGYKELKPLSRDEILKVYD